MRWLHLPTAAGIIPMAVTLAIVLPVIWLATRGIPRPPKRRRRR